MAIWQYELDAYPRDTFLAAFPDSPQVVDREVLDDINLWDGRKPPAASELCSILPVGTGWDPTMRLFGDSESNQISYFVLEDGTIDTGIRVRIDLRGPCKLLVHQVVDLCSRYDLLLLNMHGNVLEPRFDVVVQELMASSAWAFLQDPRGFLMRLADGATDDGGPEGAPRQ